MKHIATLFCGCALIAATAISCKKHNDHDNHPSARTVHYQLYTENDFSNVQDSIFFRIVILAGNVTLFDSALAPMRISEIPAKANKLTFQKRAPGGYERSTLSVGFRYAIKGVGNSWYMDTCSVGQAEKTVDYDFR